MPDPSLRPRCPWCDSHEHVEDGRHPKGRWYCTGCNLLFCGSQDEWRANAPIRAHMEAA
ncbi:MAG TPA: hypothetical protein VGB14_20405 [Acidimicrobiales bacterium]|jgi:ribosomal protein L37AE/L43A